ncbi:MAG: hypothetical protein HGA45_14105 [Chloroflexales bacterium]|nr:hypothetical protein [Chloroflexales bacterium]
MSLSDYRKTVEVRWADLDPNRHVRSTVYADYAAHARIAWMSDHGFPLEIADLIRARTGPGSALRAGQAAVIPQGPHASAALYR